MSERVRYQVLEGAPGSLITEPPERDSVAVLWGENYVQEDGRGWVVFFSNQPFAERYWKQHTALREWSKREGELREPGN